MQTQLYFSTGIINQAHQQVTNRAARQGQIEAQRFEGGVHSKTMDDDGESICRSRSKLVVTCLCAWLINFRHLNHPKPGSPANHNPEEP